MKLPLEDPNITVYPIFSNALSIILQNPYALEWTYNNFHQLVCNNGIALSFYDFDYRNCPYLLVQKFSKKFIFELKKDVIDFFIQALDYGHYLYFNINPKFITAYKLGYDLDVHDIFVYGYSKEKEIFYIADCFEDGKYAHKECSFDEVRKGLQHIKNEDEKYLTLNGCVELLSLVSKDICLSGFDYKRVKDTIIDYFNSKPTVCYNVQDFKWEYGKSFHFFGINCYKFIHKRIDILDEFIALADYHIICEHKKHLLETLNFLVRKEFIVDKQGSLLKRMIEITQKALIARNLVIKYHITRNDNIKKRLHLIYQDIETKEYYFLYDLITNVL